MGILYFRDTQTHDISTPTGKTETVNFNELSLIERLFVSAYLTKLATNTPKTLAQIIFDSNYINTYAYTHMQDFDKHITDVLKKRVNVLHWIKDTYVKTDKDFPIYAINIDMKLIFARQNRTNAERQLNR